MDETWSRSIQDITVFQARKWCFFVLEKQRNIQKYQWLIAGKQKIWKKYRKSWNHQKSLHDHRTIPKQICFHWFQAIHWTRNLGSGSCLLDVSCQQWDMSETSSNTRHFMFTRFSRFSPHKQLWALFFFSKPCLCQQQLRQPLLQQPHLKAKETENPNWKWFETSALYHQWDIHGLFNNLFDVLESGLTTSDFMNIPRRSILSVTKTSCPALPHDWAPSPTAGGISGTSPNPSSPGGG